MSEAMIIGRLRVQDLAARNGATNRAGADPLLLRLRAAHLLETADLTPPGLPPGAILTIHRLADPLPGRLTLDAPQLAPDRAWQTALTRRLGALAAQAERPLLQAVSAGAQAVLFADQAELLACLALDWLAGQLLNRWWWREVVRNRQLASAVAGAWLEGLDAAPVALGHLNRRGEAVAFLRKLDDGDVARLLTGLVERRRLAWLRETAQASLRTPSGAPWSETGPLERGGAERAARSAGGSAEGGQGASGARETRAAAAPWSGLVPAESASLSRLRQMLLGVGLGLVYAPHTVRGDAYARQALRWLEGRPDEVVESSATPSALGLAETEHRISAEHALDEQGGGAHRDEVRRDEVGSAARHEDVVRPEAAQRGAYPENEAQTVGKGETEPAAVREQPAQGEEAGVQTDMSGANVPQEVQAPAAARAAAEAAAVVGLGERAEAADLALEATEVRTGYAGLFYLVNVALGMGFYADFSQPEAEGELPLSPWAFLALIGRALIGEGLQADSVWPLLARLAGAGAAGASSDERLAAGFTPPDALSLAEWVERTAAEVFEWVAARFPVPPVDRPELARIAFARAGGIRVSAGRLDVTLRLDDLHIAVRLAGLDRNPGWVPAAGRTINFHYD